MAQSDAGVSHEAVESPTHLWADHEGLTESQLFREYVVRLVNTRDMHVIITAASETGVGKTTLALVLALLWDQHGWTLNKATLSPREYMRLYDEVGPGSVLLLDEVEQAADNRRSTSKDNVDLSQAFAGKRYRQVFGIMTAPSKGWVDDRMGADAADYWIQALEGENGRPKGEAKVYRMRENEHYETEYTEKTERISWDPMEWHGLWSRLKQLKADRFEGDSKEKYVPREEYERLKANYWNKASKKARFHFVRALYEATDLGQADIADVTQQVERDSEGDLESLSQSRVSDITRATKFEEVYSG